MGSSTIQWLYISWCLALGRDFQERIGIWRAPGEYRVAALSKAVVLDLLRDWLTLEWYLFPVMPANFLSSASRRCSVYNVYSMQCTVVSELFMMRNRPTVETDVSFSQTALLMVSIVECGFCVVLWIFMSTAVRVSREGMCGAVKLRGMLISREQWSVRAVSYSAVPNIWSDPSLI